ncbi:MAG: caspase family protein, partial [gamma proteobacterium symbiont of Taylorina sp.]|nr:caspase family protein [gamma proteobacterium symbiont of Taylorina sp.]
MPKVNHYLLLSLLILSLTPYSFAIEYSDSCGKEWEWVNPLPRGNNLLDIAWSKEQKQYIAVGNAGTILSSSDGNRWQSRFSGTDEKLSQVIWNGKRWLVIGNEENIYSSTDGVDWQKHLFKYKGDLFAVNSNGKQWIASGGEVNFNYHENINGTTNYDQEIISSFLLVSDDGINWQELPIPPGKIFTSLVWNGNKWTGVGFNGVINSSTDGINWQKQISATTMHLISINWNGQQWIALGYDGVILSSTDAIKWQRQSSESTEFLIDASSNGKQWLIVGDDSSILKSNDGKNWSKQYLTDKRLSSIVWNEEQWLVIGAEGNIFSSIDGETWQSHSTNLFSSTDSNDKIFLFSGGYIFKSQDGKNWQKQSLLVESNEDMIFSWNNQQWLIDKTGQFILNSSDGKNWNKLSAGSDKHFSSIAWNKSQFIGVSNGEIYSSSDGTDWQKQSSGMSVYLSSIRWNGSQWLVVGHTSAGAGIIFTSKNGVDWKQTFSANKYNFRYVDWLDNKWVALGNDIYHSTDGTNWQKQSIDNYPVSSINSIPAITSITSNGYQWVAVGWEGVLIFSVDGINWQVLPKVTDRIFTSTTVQWDDKQFVMVVGNNILVSSCYPKNKFSETKSIVIAGGGNANDPLQDATNENANLAYQTLRNRGIATDNIKYFNALPQDADGDGIIDTVAGTPTKASIKEAITSWAATHANSEIPVLVYLIDHGGSNLFYLNKPTNNYAEVVKADEFSSWLNTLQGQTSTRVTLVYDACHSGSFMDELKQSPAQNYDRSLLFSSTPEQLAYFGAKG